MRTNQTLVGRTDRPGRFVAIVVSLGITVLATGFFVEAFTSGSTQIAARGAGSDGPRSDGSIYFRYEDNQGQSRIGVVEPDGSGQRDAFPGSPAAQHEQISFSPDGTQMTYVDGREGSRGIYVANADGSNAVRLTDGVNDSWPNWSPDGTKIAFVGTRFDPSIDFCHPGLHADCLTDIYVMNADGSDVVHVTNDPGYEFDPAWSPDGTRIAYASDSDGAGPTAITVMNAGGTGRMKVSSSNGGSDFHPSWSPDGTQIVFGGIHYENWGLFEVRADGTDERTLLFGVGTYAVAPAWSPDGSLIAFGGNVGNYGEPEAVYVMQPDGSGITKLANLPDGWVVREIAWRSMAEAQATTARVTGTFDVGLRGQASGLTYGFGSIWVDGFESPTGLGQVIGMDPETGARQADISLGSVAPGWVVGGGGLAVGDGSLWVVGTGPSGASPGALGGVDTVLVRIDPSTDRVVDRIVLGGKVAADVTIDANGVWVLFGGDDDKMQVARVDPATDQVVATIPLAQAYGHFIFSFGSSIVAMTNETTATAIGNGVINVIDPSTNAITASVQLDAYVWPAAGDGSLWVTTGTILERIDPQSGEVLDAVRLESTGDSLAFGAGGVWSVGANGRTSISRWDPSLGTVDLTVDLPRGADANVIAASTDAVWVLGFDGSVTRVAIA